MKVLFVSGDIGGARALIPVIEKCKINSLPYVIYRNGHIIKEAPEQSQWLSVDENLPFSVASKDLLLDNDIGIVVFASSEKDPTALSLARTAQGFSLPTIHVLDSWTNYAHRMETDNLPIFKPDVYTVIDDLAYQEAMRDGIDESLLHITGQPALASLPHEYALWKKHSEENTDNPKDKRITIVFVSEPVEQDHGSTMKSPRFRGYTEKDVASRLCEALQGFSGKIKIKVLPHPREEFHEVKHYWETYRGDLNVEVILCDKSRHMIFGADAVVGMVSILLYEAWLIGKSVLSLQPGVLLEPLKMLQKRKGVLFIDSDEDITDRLNKWISSIKPGDNHTMLPELYLHEKAPQNICDLIKHYMLNPR